MARAWRIRFPGAKYHVTSRGNGRARILLCAGLTAIAASLIQADDYYVAPSGNDTTGNGSQDMPWREIRKPLTVAGEGDTIHVADGQYKGFTVSDLSGASGQPIVIQAQGSNAEVMVTVDRGDNRDTICLDSCSYITIDGLRGFNANRAGVRLEACSYIVVRNCTFGTSGYWGIFTGHCDDLLIENNHCYGSINEHGIYHSNSGDRPVIRGNLVHNNHGNGIHMNGDISMGGDGVISGALIENNVIYENGTGGGGGINMDGVQDSTIRNNLICNNHASGITSYCIDGAEGPKGQKIYSNTIVMASDGRYCILFGQSAGANYVRNNILYHPNSLKGAITYYDEDVDVPNVDSDHNIFSTVSPYIEVDDPYGHYTLSAWKTRHPGSEAASTTATLAALFVNSSASNYHIAVGSPALDAGELLADVTTDIETNKRPTRSTHDIGCYECQNADADKLSDAWEWQYFNSLTNTAGADGEDWDLDRFDDYGEYVAGTDPTNPASFFAISNALHSGASLVLHWSSVSGRVYGVESGANLISGLTNMATGLQSTPPANTYTCAMDRAVRFYRIAVTAQ